MKLPKFKGTGPELWHGTAIGNAGRVRREGIRPVRGHVALGLDVEQAADYAAAHAFWEFCHGRPPKGCLVGVKARALTRDAALCAPAADEPPCEARVVARVPTSLISRVVPWTFNMAAEATYFRGALYWATHAWRWPAYVDVATPSESLERMYELHDRCGVHRSLDLRALLVANPSPPAATGDRDPDGEVNGTTAFAGCEICRRGQHRAQTGRERGRWLHLEKRWLKLTAGAWRPGDDP